MIKSDSPSLIPYEGMVRNYVKMISTQHLSNTVKWAHVIGFPLVVMSGCFLFCFPSLLTRTILLDIMEWVIFFANF